jgi:glutathione S-transferase
MELVIGNRQWSSWSLRAWLALEHLGLDFVTTAVPLRTPDTRARIAVLSPSGKVPVLIDGEQRIWDSLAIAEYASELAGGRGWPSERARRAHARSVAAEMHAGFAALRELWPMEAATLGLEVPLTGEAARDVERIEGVWQDCRHRHAPAGPWLFGEWTIADAMFAPIVLRFRSYGARVPPACQAYMDTVLEDPPMRSWLAAAEREITGR